MSECLQCGFGGCHCTGQVSGTVAATLQCRHACVMFSQVQAFQYFYLLLQVPSGLQCGFGMMTDQACCTMPGWQRASGSLCTGGSWYS